MFNTGFLPPQALELEAAIIGAALLEADGARAAITYIKKPEYFYSLQHQEIFRSIKELAAEGITPDILTVTEQTRKNGKLEEVGGPYYIMTLTQKINSAANITKHCLIVIEKYTRRQIIAAASDLLVAAYEDTNDVFEVLASAQGVLNEANENLSIKQPETVASLFDEVIAEIADATDSKGITGVPTGISAMDKLTGGAQKGNLIIWAARPAMGKTSLMLNAARNSVLDFDIPGAIFSLEMGKRELVKKLIATESQEYSTSQLVKGQIQGGREAVKLLAQRVAKLKSRKLIIDDDPGLNIPLLRVKISKLIADYKIQFVFIDYLQLMKGEGGSREQEISSISRGLKMLAKEFDLPIIALSQLSRAVELRPDKKPMLSDLRESGAIEQDADQVAFIYRPEYYGITEDEMGNPTTGIAEVIYGKNRNGGIDTVLLRAIMKLGLFTDITEDFNEVPAPKWAQTTYPTVSKSLPASAFDNSYDNNEPPF